MFELMDHDKAYLLGFLLTDGNVYKNTVRIEIKREDEPTLHGLASVFNGSGFVAGVSRTQKPVHSSPGKVGYYSRLSVNSKELVSELASFYITPQKTKVVRLPSIESEFASSLLRGVFDGDGWVTTRRNSIEIGLCSASKAFLEDALTVLVRDLKIEPVKIREKFKGQNPNPIYSVDFYSAKAERILAYLYSSGSICLDRKHNKYRSKYHIKSPRWWTPEQLELLRSFYVPGGDLSELADLLGKSRKAVSKKIWELGLNKRA